MSLLPGHFKLIKLLAIQAYRESQDELKQDDAKPSVEETPKQATSKNPVKPKKVKPRALAD